MNTYGFSSFPSNINESAVCQLVKGIVTDNVTVNDTVAPMKKKRDILSFVNSQPSEFPLKVLVLLGPRSIVDEDFRTAFNRVIERHFGSIRSFGLDSIIEHFVEIEFERVVLGQVTYLPGYQTLYQKLSDIISWKTFTGKYEYSMIFIIRGGGGVEDKTKISDDDACKLIQRIEIPVYAAIGHAKDKKKDEINKVCYNTVADQVFETPTAAGTELAEVVAELIKRHVFRPVKNKMIEEIRVNSELSFDYLRILIQNTAKTYSQLSNELNSSIQYLDQKNSKLESEIVKLADISNNIIEVMTILNEKVIKLHLNLRV